MRIPYAVPRNVFEAYKCSDETMRLSSERDRSIRAEDEFWDEKNVTSLKVLALSVIASTWKDNPILEELPTCEDRDMLMEILPIDLPFKLVITKIEDEQYWERCSRNRWEHNNPADHGDSWRQLYCEGHLCEYLENFEPSYFESQQEKCEETIQLVQNYVHTLVLRTLRPTKKRTKFFDDEDPCVVEEEPVHHIPFAIILPQLPHLTEIRINFEVVYMNDGFEWRDFEFSVEDCMALGKGIHACPKLRKFTLSRSNLDQPRAAALLQGILGNEHIEEIDFSHCKLGDKGAYAIGEFLRVHKNLKIIHLANNDIGPEGVSGIMNGLLKREDSILKHLNLKLNPLLDDGVVHVCAYLLRKDSLEVLDLSACGITADGGAALAEVFGSGSLSFETFSLDVSNNDFNETGKRIGSKG
nr:dynein regulatory complex subunit 5-like [Osmia lignaria]